VTITTQKDSSFEGNETRQREFDIFMGDLSDPTVAVCGELLGN